MKSLIVTVLNKLSFNCPILFRQTHEGGGGGGWVGGLWWGVWVGVSSVLRLRQLGSSPVGLFRHFFRPNSCFLFIVDQ